MKRYERRDLILVFRDFLLASKEGEREGWRDELIPCCRYTFRLDVAILLIFFKKKPPFMAIEPEDFLAIGFWTSGWFPISFFDWGPSPFSIFVDDSDIYFTETHRCTGYCVYPPSISQIVLLLRSPVQPYHPFAAHHTMLLPPTIATPLNHTAPIPYASLEEPTFEHRCRKLGVGWTRL